MPSTMSVKSLLMVGFHTLTHTHRDTYTHTTHVSILVTALDNGWNFLVTEFLFSQKHLPGGGILGCLGRPTPPPGCRAGSENDTFLTMTMTCDRLKFWTGPAWRSKIIIRKPWRRKNKKKKF